MHTHAHTQARVQVLSACRWGYMTPRGVARAGRYAATRILTDARAPAPHLSCSPQGTLSAQQPSVDLRAAHTSTHCGDLILLRAEGHVSGKLLVHARPLCALPCYPSQYNNIPVIINSVDPARVSTWGHPTDAYFALPASSLWETLQTAPAAPPASTRRL
jgi:hypothetical protein